MHRLYFDAIRHKNSEMALRILDVMHPWVIRCLNDDGVSADYLLVNLDGSEALQYYLDNHPLRKKEESINEEFLSYAAFRGNINAIDLLIRKGLKFITPLHHQALLGKIELTKEKRKGFLSVADAKQLLPLELAVVQGSFENVDMLMKEMQESRIPIDFNKLLLMAVGHGHVDLIPMLISAINIEEIFDNLKVIVTINLSDKTLCSIIVKIFSSIPAEILEYAYYKAIFYALCRDRISLAGLLLDFKKQEDDKPDRKTLLKKIFHEIFKGNIPCKDEVFICIAKAFSKDFSEDPALLVEIIKDIINSQFGMWLFIFLLHLDKKTVKLAINHNNGEILYFVFKLNKVSIFYEFIALGGNILHKTESGKSILEMINQSAELQKKFRWDDRKEFHQYLTNYCEFKDLLEETSRGRELDLSLAERKIYVMVNGAVALKKMNIASIRFFLERMANYFLMTLVKCLNKNVDNKILHNLYLLSKNLINPCYLLTSDFLLINARFAISLEMYDQALIDLTLYEMYVGKLREDLKDSLLHFIEVRYSNLLLIVADGLKLQLQPKTIELLKKTLADFSYVTAGDGIYIGAVAICFEKACFDKITLAVIRQINLFKYVKKFSIDDMSLFENYRRILSILAGLELLNAWLDKYENILIKKYFSVEGGLDNIKINHENEEFLSTLKAFYECRLVIFQFMECIRGIQRSKLIHPKFSYANMEFSPSFYESKERAARGVSLIEDNIIGSVQTGKPQQTERKQKTSTDDVNDDEALDKVEESAQLMIEVETAESPDVQMLPQMPLRTVKIKRELVTSKIPSPSRSVPLDTVFFKPAQPTLSIAKFISDDIHKLRKIGNNHKLPDIFLSFAALFKPGDLKIVGSLVLNLLNSKFPSAHDVDIVYTKSLEELQRVLVKAGIVFKKDGEGKKQSYSLKYKREIDAFYLSIDIIILSRPDLPVRERLELDSKNRDVTVCAIYYDPFEENAKKQFIDFHDGKAHFNENRIVLINPDNIDVFQKFPMRIFRVIRLCELGMKLSDVDAAKIQEHKQLLMRENVKRPLKKLYRTFGRVETEAILKKYHLYEVKNIQSTIDFIYKEEESEVHKQEAGALPDNPPLSVIQSLKFNWKD